MTHKTFNACFKLAIMTLFAIGACYCLLVLAGGATSFLDWLGVL